MNISKDTEMENVAIDVGFGTTAVASNINHSTAKLDVFDSRAVVVDPEEIAKFNSVGMTKRESLLVEVDGTYYEVGPDVSAVVSDSTERKLTGDYLSSPEYKSLFKGALGQIRHTNTIDLLVGGLPINHLNRKEEMQQFIEGEHRVGSRVITVKKAILVPQPFGALTHYAKIKSMELNCDIAAVLAGKRFVTIDPGYGTFDFLTTTGLTPDEKCSDAKPLGQGVILNRLSKYLTSVFGYYIHPEIIDKAFRTKVLRLKGTEYSFPDGGEYFNCLPHIDRVCREACDIVKNKLDAAIDIDGFLIAGGPALDYARAVKAAYPNHNVEIVPDHGTAVCRGLAELARQLGGNQTRKVA